MTKRKIEVLFTDRCDTCKRTVKRGETAFLNEMMRLTCKECNDIRA